MNIENEQVKDNKKENQVNNNMLNMNVNNQYYSPSNSVQRSGVMGRPISSQLKQKYEKVIEDKNKEIRELDKTNQLLKDLGIMKIDENGMLTIENGISDFIIADECCKRSYIKGAFVACATSNIIIKNYDNMKSNSGYHLEFVFGFEKIAQDFVNLLKSNDPEIFLVI